MVLKREPLADWASNGGSKAWGGAPAPTGRNIRIGGSRPSLGAGAVGQLMGTTREPRGGSVDRRDVTLPTIPKPVSQVVKGALNPRILTPPPVMKKKEKGTLEILVEGINKIFKQTTPLRGEDNMSHIFGIPHSLGEAAGQVLGSVLGVNYPSQRVQGFAPTDSSFSLVSEGLDYFTGGVGTTVAEAVIDNATGECIGVRKRKSRKRKRRLATLSDIKDLAALKQVLGGGKAFDTWIATRGR